MSYSPSKKNLEHFRCLGMLSTDPSSPCSVINNRSFGKLELFDFVKGEAGEVD